MKQLPIFIPQGYALAFTTVAANSGTFTRQAEPGGAKYTPTAFVASTAYTVGPFNEPRQYQLEYIGQDLTYTLTASGVYTALDDITIAEGLTLKADAVQFPNIEEIGIAATGTEIATAVNSIIAALIEAGIVVDEA